MYTIVLSLDPKKLDDVHVTYELEELGLRNVKHYISSNIVKGDIKPGNLDYLKLYSLPYVMGYHIDDGYHAPIV